MSDHHDIHDDRHIGEYEYDDDTLDDAPERDLADQTYRATMLQQVRELRAEVARLREALEPTVRRLEQVLAGQPVRDADEVILAARRVLEQTDE